MARIYLSPPYVGEEERRMLLEAFDSNWIAPLGPQVDAFEREMAAVIGVEHAAALSSGTAGLHLALIILGIGRGDDVLTSTLTFAATANAITYVGARPVFIDSNRSTWDIDPELLAAEIERRAALNKLPKAVVVVDLYGQCADYAPILAACERYEIPLIEDAAEALGATYQGRMAGGFGRIGVLSFNGNKIITTSGGGMLLSNNQAHVAKARFLATQARDSAPHYQHSQIGYNYRMSNLLAALGRAQLQSLAQRVAKRRDNNVAYRRLLGHLPGILFMPEGPRCKSTFWLTCIVIDGRLFGASSAEVRQHLEKCDIEARPVWKPLHLQPIFADCPKCGGEVAEDLFARGLCIPSGSNLSQAEIERIVHEILSCRRS
jgi:dTDP-4-amino-4,6-dideoxygalactose transaminase